MKLLSTINFCLYAIIGWHFVVPILYWAKTSIKKIILATISDSDQPIFCNNFFSWGQAEGKLYLQGPDGPDSSTVQSSHPTQHAAVEENASLVHLDP